MSDLCTKKGKEKWLGKLNTFESKEQMEDPIACITSTAEQIATFNDSMSA